MNEVNFATVIPVIMLIMPVAVGGLFLSVIQHAIRNDRLNTESATYRAKTRMLACVSIGISYHMILTTYANSILHKYGSTVEVDLVIVECLFLAATVPAVFLLWRQTRRVKTAATTTTI